MVVRSWQLASVHALTCTMFEVTGIEPQSRVCKSMLGQPCVEWVANSLLR